MLLRESRMCVFSKEAMRNVKSWLIGKDSDAGRDWGQEEKGTTQDEMAGWHHWLDGHESEWTPGVGDGQRGLACCDLWGCKESVMTERMNWTELKWTEGKRKYNRPDLEVSVSEWENKVINIKSDKKDQWKVDPEKRVLCMVAVFLGCWTAFDNGY